MSMTKQAVMFDRDGTIIVERHYLSRPNDVELIPGVAEAMSRLQVAGFALVVLTNQSGIAREFFELGDLEKVHDRLRDLLAAEGVDLDGIYYCPHHPEEQCCCRKPAPGMIEKAVEALGFDPEKSTMIGDKVCDIKLGESVGATTILVRTGYGRQIEREGVCKPDYIADDVVEAVRWIELQCQ